MSFSYLRSMIAALACAVLSFSSLGYAASPPGNFSLADIRSGVYTFEVVSSSSTPCYLSYNNQTCTKATVGPVIRTGTTLWNKWYVQVLRRLEAAAEVSLQSISGKCAQATLGRLDNDFCAVPPYATKVVLYEQSGSARSPGDYQRFRLVPAGDGSALHIIAADKPSSCARFLGATTCNRSRPHLAFEDEEGVRTSWRMTYVGQTASEPSKNPQTPASETTVSFPPPPVRPAEVQGPSIASSATSVYGFVTITFPQFGGCTEKSFTITYGPPSGTSSTVEVPARESLKTVGVGLALQEYGVVALSAVGNCADGSTTARSNELRLMNRQPVAVGVPSSPPPPPSPPPPSPPPPPPPANFAYPYGVALSGSTIFVTNANSGTVTSCSVSGTTVSSCASAGTGFGGALGIAIAGSYAYIVDAGGNSVFRCTVSGASLASCATMTISSYAFNIPRGIAVSGSTAFITSGPTGGSQIVTSCTISGTTLTGCAITGSNFNAPRTTAITGSTAFVTNYGSNTNSVTSCAVSGSTLGSCATNSVNINRATGIAIDGSTAFVTNAFDNTVVACTVSSGSTPETISSCSNALSSLNLPNEIAVVSSVAYLAQGGSNTLTACTVAGATLTNCQNYT